MPIVKRNLKTAFGSVLKELREEQGLSQQELADYAEIDRTYVFELERGKYYPSLNVVYKIAEVLNVKPHDLIEKIDVIMKI